MSTQKLVIFDLDGTLIDTAALMVESVIASFASIGEAAPDNKIIRSISGLGFETGIRRIAPQLSATQIRDFAAFYRKTYLAATTSSMRETLFPGAMEALSTLTNREDILLAVATGKSRRGTDRVLEEHNIYSLFTSIQTPDNCIAKPDPDMIYTAMGLVDAHKAATVMIGDTNHDMEMAVAAGVKSVGVSWGYHEVNDLRRAGANTIIDKFEALNDAIDKLTASSNA